VSVEGNLRIELLCQDHRIRQVRILSSRPLQLPLLFEGKPVQEVLQTIPMLYSICATAQARAAATACRQALAVETDRSVEEAESMLVWFETAREHLWRVLIDWPGLLDEPVDRQQVAGLSRLIPDARNALFDAAAPAFSLQPRLHTDAEGLARLVSRLAEMLEQSTFGFPPQAWFDMDQIAALKQWIEGKQTVASRYLAQLLDQGIERLGRSGVEALPELDAAPLHDRLQQSDALNFIAAPEWQQAPRETSSLTRQLGHPLIDAMLPVYGKGLLTRLVARLLELASIPGRLLQDLNRLTRGESESAIVTTTRAGDGLGVVEAARGRLFHRVSVSDGIVKRYQILAPTEWNFHPHGLVAQGLLDMPCDYQSALQQQAGLFVNAVDPCVGYSFECV
jgi:coenzyme F420-reducing hydrogenase alpha subunit